MNISAVVITCNEERNIERCLKSLNFCSEIIVVDSFSDDATRELAKKYTPHVFTRPWGGYTDQKNYAVSLAKHDWILSLDADEETTRELIDEIQGLPMNGPVAYTIPRRTLHSGKWIRFGGWYPNRLVRLFRKSQGSWVGAQLHERWECQGKIAALRADLLHHSFDGIADQVERNNRYSTLGALNLSDTGIRFSTLKLILKPPMKFFETYFLKFGFLDGYAGFHISVSAAYSVFLKWAKLWEVQHGHETKRLHSRT